MENDVTTVSDELIRQAAEDSAAFETIHRRMEPLTATLTERFAPDGADRDEIAQECRIGLLSAIRTYRPDGGAVFTTYACTCIRNRLISLSRRNATRLAREEPLTEENGLPDPEACDPAGRLVEEEDASRLRRVLQERLTPLEYEVLLARLNGCSYEETAARLGISPKAVDNAVQRLRRKLSAQP